MERNALRVMIVDESMNVVPHLAFSNPILQAKLAKEMGLLPPQSATVLMITLQTRALCPLLVFSINQHHVPCMMLEL